MKILIVDDENTIREILGDILSQEGFEIEKASDGFEALEKFNRSKFDIVLTDIIMPGMEGLALIEKIKKQSPDTGFIAMSGGGFAGPLFYLESAEAFGADRTIVKPIKRVELLEAIAQITQK